MIAINKKHQSNVNKALSWINKYDDYNDQRDEIENAQENSWSYTTEWNRINKKCETAYDKYLDYCSLLPKQEIKGVDKASRYYSETKI